MVQMQPDRLRIAETIETLEINRAADEARRRLPAIDASASLDRDNFSSFGQKRLAPVWRFTLNLVEIQALAIVIFVQHQRDCKAVPGDDRFDRGDDRNLVAVKGAVEIVAGFGEAAIVHQSPGIEAGENK